MHTRIIVTASVVGFHHWPDAPVHLGWLRHLHRHVFHFRLECPVDHENRAIEFCELKERLETILRANMPMHYDPAWEKDDPAHSEATVGYSSTTNPDTLSWSCEMWADFILQSIPQAARCDVMEDNENGGFKTRSPEEVKAAVDAWLKEDIKTE